MWSTAGRHRLALLVLYSKGLTEILVQNKLGPYAFFFFFFGTQQGLTCNLNGEQTLSHAVTRMKTPKVAFCGMFLSERVF